MERWYRSSSDRGSIIILYCSSTHRPYRALGRVGIIYSILYRDYSKIGHHRIEKTTCKGSSRSSRKINLIILTMDIITCITHTDGTKSIQYGEQHLADSRGIEQYSYKGVTPETIEEIKTTTTDKIQALFAKLF